MKKLSQLNEIFSVRSDVMSSLSSLMNKYGGHIENTEMKSDRGHFGQMAGLNDNHVKPDTAHYTKTLYYKLSSW